MTSNPYTMLSEWLNLAKQVVGERYEAFTLATASSQGEVSARVLLYKGEIEGELLFFTNYLSEKGQQLEQNPKAEMVFFWAPLHKQIRIKGSVKKCSEETSTKYFNSRAKESQLASALSKQSQPLESYQRFLNQFQLELEQIEKVERPEHWGGYLLSPTKFEFWEHGEHRLNKRQVFKRDQDSQWRCHLLYP